MVDLADRYTVSSNRESGFGRYDIMLEPKKTGGDAIILEFKVRNPRREESLEDTVQSALGQIENKIMPVCCWKREFLQIISVSMALPLKEKTF